MVRIVSHLMDYTYSEHTLELDIDGKMYEYKVNGYIASKFTSLLEKGRGYSALNWLKRNINKEK